MEARSSRRALTRLVAAAALALVPPALLAVQGCSGKDRASTTPVASLGGTTAAGRAFAQVRRAWERHDEAHDDWGAAANDAGEAEDRQLTGRLRVVLENFLAHYPTDGLADVARAYLAFVRMEENQWTLAHGEIDALAGTPPGSTENLVTIARARLLRHDGQPAQGVTLLRPLVGKVVDPIARGLFLEEIALDAVAAHEDYEALAYLDAWLRGAPEDKRDAVRTNVQMWLKALPAQVLENTYRAMRASRDVTGYGGEIEQLVGERLAVVAVERGDSELARWLLDPEAGAPSFALAFGDAGAEVAELATSLRGIDSVVGRTLGVLVPSSAAVRDPAVALLRGVAWAFDVPRIDPNAEEGVRFVTRDDGGDPALTERALDELLGEGASVIVAGIDPTSTARVFAWGEKRGVPVIAVAALPEGSPALGAFSFTAGEPRSRELAALAEALQKDPLDKRSAVDAIGAVSPAPDADEAAIVRALPPASAGRFYAASCASTAARAGDARFPFASWSRAKVRSVIVAGNIGCARDAIEEASAVGASWTFGLTFDATWLRTGSAVEPVGRRPRRLAVAAGLMPVAQASPDGAGEEELRGYMTHFDGRPNWFAALGRDAARLARQALAALPTDTATDPAEVKRRRVVARDALLKAHARLWTSDSDAFDPGHAIPRTLHVVDLPR